MVEKDIEAVGPPKPIPYFKQLSDKAGITPEVEAWKYAGSGTEEDPYAVTWIDHDPRNPLLYPAATKWAIAILVGLHTLTVSFVSSAYTGGAEGVMRDFHVNEVIFTLGLSLFVLGFALGPLLWAPFSELYGRQPIFIITFGALAAFTAGAAGSQNIATLVILRFFAGAFGSSPLVNAGGVLADLFNARQRGMAMAVWVAAPCAGPIMGPIIGGFVGETVGWRWIQGISAILAGVLWIGSSLLLPETYAPVLLRERAKQLSRKTGKIYRSRGDIDRGPVTVGRLVQTNLLRPWVLLFLEPIVLLMSIYMAIIYGILYMLFGAFPIVFQENRGWSPGIGGLAFLGVLVGMVGAVAYNFWDDKRYQRISDQHGGFAPPETRLPTVMLGGCMIPIGLFWFAWTNSPSIHWIVPIMAGIPFGFGLVLCFLGLMTYLVDSYTIYAASALAANSVLRSLFGAAFPLFTPYMYENLGIHWASSLPAFLSVACLPFPFIFYKYGPAIRARCKYAAEAAAFLQRLQAGAAAAKAPATATSVPPSVASELQEKGTEDDQESRNEKNIST